MIYTQELVAEVLKVIDETTLSEKEALKRCLSGKIDDHKIWSCVHAYVFEIVKRKNLIDFIIKHSLRGDFDTLNPIFRNLLRVCVYEMHFKGVHPALATDSIVRIVKQRFGLKMASLANAILRRAEHFDYEKAIERLRRKDEIKYLALKYYHPEWYVKYAIELLGKDEAVRLMIANNQKQSIYVRVNELKADIESVRRYLESNKVEIVETPLPEVFKVIKYEKPPSVLDWHAEGKYVIQDLASCFVTHVLKPEPNEVILDLAAAPGLKTSHIASFMENTGKIIAVDNSADRLKRMKAKLKQLGVKNVVCKLADGTKFYIGEVDRVLVDPPCSSTGSFRNYPCVKWRFDKAKFLKTIEVQRGMIANAFRNLKSGGVLVYSTCSITFEENEENVIFASEFFKVEEVKAIIGVRGIRKFKKRIFPFWDKVVRTYPHLHDTVGFFISKLEKV
jgi:16S rRNA (cytosine967-C5)-methyltransferase